MSVSDMDVGGFDEEYAEPDRDSLCELLHRNVDVIGDVSDWRSKIDNRTSARMLLMLRGVSNETFGLLTEPYDNGFYRRSDGKSSPFGFLKMMRMQRVLGFKKDMVSIRHDLDYYRGLDRALSDNRYYELQIEMGYQYWRARLEFIALRVFGWIAWYKHQSKRKTIKGYGRDEYIISGLPVIEY